MATNYFKEYKDRLIDLLREKFPYGIAIEREDVIEGESSICLDTQDWTLIETVGVVNIEEYSIDIIIRRRVVEDELADDKLCEIMENVKEQLWKYRNDESNGYWFDSRISGADAPETEETEEGEEILRKIVLHWHGKVKYVLP